MNNHEHGIIVQRQIDQLLMSKTCSQYLPWLYRGNLTICILAAREVWGLDIDNNTTIIPYKKNLGDSFEVQIEFHKSAKEIWDKHGILSDVDDWDPKFIDRLKKC